MRTRRRQRGAGKVGTIIGLAVLVLVAYGLLVYLPVWANINEMKDYLKDQAIYIGADSESYGDRVAKAKENIQAKWKEIGLVKPPKPLTDEQLKFERSGSSNRIIWRIDLPIRTVFKTFTKKIDHTAEAPFI